MARHVADVRAGLEILAGQHWRDPAVRARRSSPTRSRRAADDRRARRPTRRQDRRRDRGVDPLGRRPAVRRRPRRRRDHTARVRAGDRTLDGDPHRRPPGPARPVGARDGRRRPDDHQRLRLEGSADGVPERTDRARRPVSDHAVVVRVLRRPPDPALAHLGAAGVRPRGRHRSDRQRHRPRRHDQARHACQRARHPLGRHPGGTVRRTPRRRAGDGRPVHRPALPDGRRPRSSRSSACSPRSIPSRADPVSPKLVALDLPGGREFVEQLQRIWDAGDAAFPVDQRLPAAARQGLYLAMGVGDEVEPGDALVVATSGSTGAPKGVVLTHDAVAASAEATSRRLGVGRDDHWLACLPLSHVGGLSVVTRALHSGTRLTVHADVRRRRGGCDRRHARLARVDGAAPDRPDAVPLHRARREPTAVRPTVQHRDDLRHDRDRKRCRLRRRAARRRRGAHRR